MDKRTTRFDLLDAHELVRTMVELERDISNQFAGRGLSKVAGRMIIVIKEADAVAEATMRDNWPLRIGLVLFMATTIVGPVLIARAAGFHIAPIENASWSLADLLQSLDGLFNVVVLGVAGILFATTLEERLKRRTVLKQLHRIRSLTHVVDMHQMNKDPGRTPPEELKAYLGFCTDLLSLLGKIAALFAQGARDAVVIDAVNDIETLANNLSRKIWQKIALADRPLAAGD